MSGFFGELSFTNAAPSPGTLTAMDRAMAYWGRDGGGRWHNGPIALGARLLRVTAEDALDQQPLVEPDLVLVGHVRLDDRKHLAHALGLDRADCLTIPDSRLLALAWRRWGEACAEHLMGDWVCAIWDRRRQTLWLGRDAAGNTGVYYWHGASRLVFSTSLKALLAHPAVPRQPDAYHLARLLTVFHDPAQADSTAYAGIRRLPGGQALRAGPGGVTAYRWWHPEQLGEFERAPEEDYFSAFRAIYQQAVTDRLRKAEGPVAMMLSAGLDSGSVAAFAAPHLAERGERLLAFSSVPCHPPHGAPAHRLGDEGPLARATAEYIGHMAFIPVAAERASLLAAIERQLDIHDQPGHAAGNYYWMLDILSLARERGARVLLTGQGGNATVSWTGTGNLWPELRAGEWGVVLGALRGHPADAWRVLKRRILGPVIQPPLHAFRRLRRNDTPPWTRYSAIHPEFAREIQLDARMRAARHDPDFGGHPDPRHPRTAGFRLCQSNSAALGSLWMENGAAHHLEVRDPTRDRRVIEFCWRVPDRVFWSQGRRRGLIRQGLSGYLPEAILDSRRKGLQAADLGHRLRAESDAVRVALERLAAQPLARHWLDIAQLRAVFKDLEREVTPVTTLSSASILLRGLGVGLFLTRF